MKLIKMIKSYKKLKRNLNFKRNIVNFKITNMKNQIIINNTTIITINSQGLSLLQKIKLVN